MIQYKKVLPFGEAPQNISVLWRAEVKSYTYCSEPESDIWSLTAPRLELTWWEIKNTTPCGARLFTGRFVNLKNSLKEWASSSKEEALRQLCFRRKKQISILTRQLSNAQKELQIAEHFYNQAPTQ